MAAKTHTIKTLSASSMAAKRTPFVVRNGENDITLYVRELSYFETTQLYGVSSTEDKYSLGLLVSAAVEDEEGNRFTYDEAMNLRKEVAEPLLEEVARVNRMGKYATKN